MPRIPQKAILDLTTTRYLSSNDFNGSPASFVCEHFNISWSTLRPLIQRLIERNLLGVITSETSMNPHILRIQFPPVERQIETLNGNDLHHTCLYPRPKHLKNVVDAHEYSGTPYRFLLALGEPHLAFRSFDLTILELYRNDPRYSYDCNDIGGSICVRDKFYESDEMLERDQIVLNSFGFAFDEQLNRAVAAFITDLAELSPEHQQLWRAKEHTENFNVHPDWYNSQVGGRWGHGVSIFSAFLHEQYLINQMSCAMNRPPLFRKDFGKYHEGKPREFAFLVRPTLNEFNSFVLLLDKLISENIDRKFFGDDIPLETETIRDDGKIQLNRKGTLTLLDEWIRRAFSTNDWEPWNAAINTLREVRKMRQKPAHAVTENDFDQKYIRKQRELMVHVYDALSVLRGVFQIHPDVVDSEIDIPDWLTADRILTI